MMRRVMMAILVGAWLASLAAAAGAAEVLPARDVCQPTTSAKARDGNCVPCATGPISTRPGFPALLEQVRTRGAAFADIDRRIDGASSDPEVQTLLQ